MDLIISHTGGTLPFISQRVPGSLIIPKISSKSRVTATKAVAQFRQYYYDTAPSGSGI
jgi:hypothetical protein